MKKLDPGDFVEADHGYNGEIDKIRLSNRKKKDKDNIYSRLTVDGVDFEIYEPTAFSGKWFSHKSNGPAVRYKIAISIVGDNIC